MSNVPSEEHGIQMIIFNQAQFGIEETREQATKGWRAMNIREKQITRAFYEAFGGPELE